MALAQSLLSTPYGDDTERTVVTLRGEHDVSTVAALSATLAEAIALDDADLVLDLSEVEYLGAGAVDVVIRAREFLRLRSRSLALRAPSPSALRVLEVCELTDLIETDALPVVATLGTRPRRTACSTRPR